MMGTPEEWPGWATAMADEIARLKRELAMRDQQIAQLQSLLRPLVDPEEHLYIGYDGFREEVACMYCGSWPDHGGGCPVLLAQAALAGDEHGGEQ